MPSLHSFPKRVTVSLRYLSTEGLAVCLRFGMRTKNSFNYLVFLDSRGTAQVSGGELLKVFDEERRAFLMDYDDPRIGFNGEITAKVLDASELRSALEAYKMFRGKLSFPEGYEERLMAALTRGQNPGESQVEVKCSDTLE